MIHTLLAEKPDSKITLMYPNRSKESTIFAKELALLETKSPNFNIKNFISGQNRLDQSDINTIVKTNPNIEIYICGPLGLKAVVKGYLKEANVAENKIHSEDFADGYVSWFGIGKHFSKR